MQEIKMKEIDLPTLRKLQNQGTNSTVYTDGKMCYKFLDGLYPNEKRDLYRKFLDMDGIEIDHVLLPKDLIIKDGELNGYTMQYFQDSMPLSDKFLRRYFNCQELFEYVEKASKILRNIHNQDIFCQDLSFENILIDKEGNIAFCDIDGCTYKNHISPFYSILFKEFLVDYRKSKVSSFEDVDKISMILSFYLILYGELLQKISRRQYDILANNIHTLENLREVFNMLIDKKVKISNIPYLDEVIDLNDNYIVDRERVLSLKQTIFRRL